MLDWVKKRLIIESLDFDSSQILENYNNMIVNYKNREFVISINSNYPFKPPKCSFNGVTLNYSYQNIPKRLLSYYLNEGNSCFCCHNILCPDNWSPLHRLIDIFEEYTRFVDNLKITYKKKIIQKLNLPDDMIYYISSFL
jgi:hypothetical protein